MSLREIWMMRWSMGWLTTLLALAMVLSPALGQMHRAVHAGATQNVAHGPHWGHAAATTALLTQATVVSSAADCIGASSERSGCASDLSWVHALFAGHGPAECQLLDQANHGYAGPPAVVAFVAPVPATALPQSFAPEPRTIFFAAPFDARGPPSLLSSMA